MTSTVDLIERFFAADGPIARRLPGYVPRRAQIDMALAVAEALEQQRGRLVVEAGTGTGKSLAYLVPALLSGKRVVVATATKALQDQLYTKDVPLAIAALGELIESEPVAALMKGRNNYLCKMRYARFTMAPMFAFAADAGPFATIQRWAARTTSGDRAEIEGLPDNYPAWAELDGGSETCLGQRCPDFEDCFVTTMRRGAEAAQLIVANHHLVCADLRLRFEARDEESGAGFAQVIPKADAYILDEAHALPDIATEYFGLQASSAKVERLVLDARKLSDGLLDNTRRATLLDRTVDVEEAVERLFGYLKPYASHERANLQGRVPLEEMKPLLEAASTTLMALSTHLDELGDEAFGDGKDALTQAAERTALVRRSASVEQEISFVLGKAPVDVRFVVFLEGSRRGVTVTAAPIDIGEALAQTLFALDEPVILTSATLAMAEDAGPFQRRVGMRKGESRIFPSPFDHEHRAALYCPQGMPEPEEPSWIERFDDEAAFLLGLSRGGALLLFTSHKAMEDASVRLRPVLERLGLRGMKQGDAPKGRLLDAMRAHDGDDGAVLFATHSFWEGVDVRGRALRLVVIDRLPFKVPSDPLQQARAELCKKRGGNPFADIALPDAALTLKQGAGRLLRSVDDAGVVSILDGRLRNRPYGPRLLRTLPPMTRVGSRRALVAFWERFVAPPLNLKLAPREASAADR